MLWHELVFSQSQRKRLLRHLIFWLSWWIYFSVCYYLYQQPTPLTFQPYFVTVGSPLLVKTALVVLINVIACYSCIYIFMPFIIKGKWLSVALIAVTLGFFLIVAAWLIYWNLFPLIDSLFGFQVEYHFYTRFWPAVTLGIINPTKVIAFAFTIKYVKSWWLKNTESIKLEREKINAEYQLLKAQIRPSFLFQALNNIYKNSVVGSPRAPELLLNLSDLLSYMLYECDQPSVPLEKEIQMIKKYAMLEKNRLSSSIDMEFNIKGNFSSKFIAPFLLLPFIENSFKQSISCTEQAWINIDFSIQDGIFNMKLANGIMTQESNSKLITEDRLANVQKRLTLLYPQNYELKISQEQDMLVVLLEIRLTKSAALQSLENQVA